jgi:ankyrin repeat protein
VVIAGLCFLSLGAGLQAAPFPESLTRYTTISRAHEEKIDLLIEAIDNDDTKSFEHLLTQGVDINGTSLEGWTPLGYAAAEGKLRYVKRLLEKGAKVNAPGYDRQSPLMAAAREGHLPIVELLVEKGASLQEAREEQSALASAAREGHLAIVRYLLPKSPTLSGEQKVDFLLMAIDEDHKELFDFWLSQGADINGVGQGDRTPLGFAAEEGRLAYIKELISKGANINHPQGDERMPLLGAAREGKLAVVEVLLEAGTQVDQSSANGTTALSVAAREGHVKVVEYLLSKGANLNKANREGWAALHLATVEGHTELMKRLIRAGADKEAAISTEWTNINLRSGRRVIMQGWTPLLLAIEEEKIEATQVLLEAGANVQVGVEKTVYLLEGEFEKQKKSAGSLLYVATGWTPLMEAVEKQNLSLVKLLLAKGADKNAQTTQGMSAQSIAREKGNKAIIDLLK